MSLLSRYAINQHGINARMSKPPRDLAGAPRWLGLIAAPTGWPRDTQVYAVGRHLRLRTPGSASGSRFGPEWCVGERPPRRAGSGDASRDPPRPCAPAAPGSRSGRTGRYPGLMRRQPGRGPLRARRRCTTRSVPPRAWRPAVPAEAGVPSPRAITAVGGPSSRAITEPYIQKARRTAGVTGSGKAAPRAGPVAGDRDQVTVSSRP